MPVNLPPIDPAQLQPVAGVRWGVTEAGVRKAHRKDLSVMLLEEGASVAGVFTSNRFCAAPVQVCREHLQTTHGIRAMVINTGNANAGTGAPGLAHARQTCEAMAQLLQCQHAEIQPCTTAVSMEPLPVEGLVGGVPGARG
ncbi:MAG: bifunctional ornithine acetyltransferase/N-acetylglutamate synthase, partial [Limnohabitans sp.]